MEQRMPSCHRGGVVRAELVAAVQACMLVWPRYQEGAATVWLCRDLASSRAKGEGVRCVVLSCLGRSREA